MSDSREKSRRSVLGLEEESRDLDTCAPKRRRNGSSEPNLWHARFVEFFEFSPIPFIILSHQTITEVNVSACELFGLGIGKIKKRSFNSFFQEPEKIDTLLVDVRKGSTTVESIVSLKSGDRVRLHAMRFLQNGEKVRIGLTRETSDPRDVSRLKHVMLAAKDAICIYSPEGQTSSNKAARVLLRNHNFDALDSLLHSLGIRDGVAAIDILLERRNIWKRPISLEGLAYRLTISHIYCELSPVTEYLVQISPLENSEENSLLQQARSVDSVSDLALSPLTVISSATSLLKILDPKSESFTNVLSLLENNVNVLGSLFGGLSALAHDNLAFESVPIVSILSDAVERVRRVSELNVEIEIENPGSLIWVEREIAVNVLFELLLKCTRKSLKHALKIIVEESSTHLSFDIFCVDGREEEPEIYLKRTRETLAQMGANVHKVLAGHDSAACISMIFLRGKK